MWTAPRTNWQPTDSFTLATDYTRIKGNILHLHSIAQRLYPSFVLADMHTYTIDGLPWAAFFNAVEGNLERMYTGSFRRGDYVSRTLRENEPVWDWRDLNRIEGILLQICNDLAAQGNAKPVLSFLMGGAAFGTSI